MMDWVSKDDIEQNFGSLWKTVYNRATLFADAKSSMIRKDIIRNGRPTSCLYSSSKYSVDSLIKMYEHFLKNVNHHTHKNTVKKWGIILSKLKEIKNS